MSLQSTDCLKRRNYSMKKVPDYREIDCYVSMSNVKDQIIALLYASGMIHDNEDVIDLQIRSDLGGRDTVPLSIKIKKQQQVEVFNYWLYRI